MAEDRCPRCFTIVSGFATGESADWTDDPILTPKGEAGDDYIGFTNLKPIHIQEIQEVRTQQEIDAGIAEIDRTTFTEIDTSDGNIVDFLKSHILELRESTEKILNTIGQTKEAYFNYDDDGTEYNIGDHQLDWIDPELEDIAYPDIKAYHIEDLRHFLVLTWFDDFTNIDPEDIQSVSASKSLSGNGSVEQVDDDTDTYNDDLTDNKSNELDNSISAYSQCRLREVGFGESLGTQSASASVSSTADRTKPFNINISSTVSVNCNVNHDGSGSDFARTTDFVRLSWVANQFINPSPRPNILINDNSKVYIDLTGSWSDGRSNWFEAVKSKYDEFVAISIQIIFRGESDQSYPLTIVFQASDPTTVEGWLFGSYYKPLIDGRNFVEVKALLDFLYPGATAIKKYFCKSFFITAVARSQCKLEQGHGSGITSASASASMDIDISKVGITN